MATLPAGPWIRRFHPADGAATRLVCLPHAGGAATYYFPVSRALSPGVDVLAVQYPGRQDRRTESCISDIRVFADRIVAELHPWLDRPFALFGHSMGATIGFEVALRLESRGLVPTTLFASGRRAPSRVRDENVHTRSDDQVIAELSSLSGTDTQILDDPEMRRIVLRAVRADYTAIETYRYQDGPRLSCPVEVLTGDADPQVTPDEARDWARHTTGGVNVHVFPGDHFYLNQHVPAIIEQLARHARQSIVIPSG